MKKTGFIILCTILLAACTTDKTKSGILYLEKGWKINMGDNPDWADPAFDDSNWKNINPGITWEAQFEEYKTYDGLAWYRISFLLPKKLKEKAYFGNEIQFSLGKIDDTEQTYLNGEFLGQNNVLYSDSIDKSVKFEVEPSAYNISRNYILPVEDSRLKWGEINVLAIRVNDSGGGGGLYYSSPSISMIDIKDYLKIDVFSSPFEIKGDSYIKNIRIKNMHSSEDFNGILTVKVSSNFNGSFIYKSKDKLLVRANSQTDHIFTFSAPQSESYKIEYHYAIDGAHYPIYLSQDAPYILTPPSSGEAHINGPAVVGVRPGHQLVYAVPCSGVRPMYFTAENLPEGVTLDSLSGFLRGTILHEGEYPVLLRASNSLGEDVKNFTIKVGKNIQLTPPMGWNSWNCWGLSVSDEKVRASARAMIESGLRDYGWTYMNIDDGWEASRRTGNAYLLSNEKFPDMNALSAYIHDLGLKIGIYSSPGPYTCGGFPGSYQHELLDARTWSYWGIDYLKYDWCSYGQIAENEHDPDELQKPYLLMRSALDQVHRDIVYSLCQYGMGDVSSWGAEVGGNLWRTTGDISDTWESLKSIGFSQFKHSEYAKPGNYNDPDMMILGWVGWGPNLHPTRLSPDEQYTHVSLWCLLSAPLLLGNDLARMDDFTTSLLTNSEVLDVNQDQLCDQADRIYSKDSIQVWMKNMSDGSKALGFFNMEEKKREITVSSRDLGLSGTYRARDLWRQEDAGEFTDEIHVNIYPHGVYLIRIREVED